MKKAHKLKHQEKLKANPNLKRGKIKRRVAMNLKAQSPTSNKIFKMATKINFG